MSTEFLAAACGPKRQPGVQRAWLNRRILAERLHWPNGVLDACELLEDKHPGWQVWWLAENVISGFERPAGYHALRDGMHSVDILGRQPEVVDRAMTQAPPEHVYRGCWCKGCDVPRVLRVRLDGPLIDP